MKPSTKSRAGRAIFWLSLPLLIPQALAVRRRALRLPAARGPGAGSYGDGKPLILLALGDSIIAGVGAQRTCDALPAQFAAALAEQSGRQVKWHAYGNSGDTIAELPQTIRNHTLSQRADVVLISIGVNDVTGLSGTRRWRRGFQNLMTLLRERWPQAVLLFIGLPPMAEFPALPQPLATVLGARAAHFDREMAAMLVNDSRSSHVPVKLQGSGELFCEDGFHPSESSYTRVGVVLADTVLPMIQS